LTRVRSFEVKRIKGGDTSLSSEELVAEETVTLLVNGGKLLSFQCIPEMCEELAVGFLITEGLADSPSEISSVKWLAEKREISAKLNISQERLREFREALVAGSSCGKAISSGKPFDPLDCKRKIDLSFRINGAVLLSAMNEFRKRAAHPGRPSGVHASAIAQGVEILSFTEDVGRHNAVDKVVGHCALRGIALHDKMLLTTGRISLEVAAKALRAGLPLIASTRGPTATAVDLARNSSITVVGFVTAGSMTLYSAEWRVE
jgi:FdhD protein